MHVTMEVSAPDIVRALSNDPNNPTLVKAIQASEAEGRTVQTPFVDIFARQLRAVSGNQPLASFFASKATRGRMDFNAKDEDVVKYLKGEVDNTIERSFEILRARIDKFGVTSPNIQQLRGTNRIQIELPGVENPERVRKLLQGAAKLEFFEVYETSDYSAGFQGLNTLLAKEEAAAKLGGGKKAETAAEALGASTEAVSAEDSAKNATLAALAGDSGKIDTGKSLAANAKKDSAKKDTAQSSQLARLFVPLYDGLGVNVKDTGKVNRLFARPEVKALFPNNLTFYYDVKPRDFGNGANIVALYAIRKDRDGKAPLEGNVISDARQDFSSTGSEPEVLMQMNGEGARKWKRLTAQNTGKTHRHHIR